MVLAVLSLVASALLGEPDAAAAHLYTPCPTLTQAIRLRARQSVLRGDVDGDGRTDIVALRYAPRARSTCGFFVVVESQRRAYAARVPMRGKGGAVPTVAQYLREYPEPYIGALVRIDPRGLKVLVGVDHGASTVTAAIYGLRRGRLISMHFSPSFRGPVELQEQYDCYRGPGSGMIVETSEVGLGPTSRRWEFQRTFFRSTGSSFRQTAQRTTIVSTAAAQKLKRRWGLGRRPFRSCTVAGGF